MTIVRPPCTPAPPAGRWHGEHWHCPHWYDGGRCCTCGSDDDD